MLDRKRLGTIKGSFLKQKHSKSLNRVIVLYINLVNYFNSINVMKTVDFGWEESPKIPFKKRAHISILLGAGFSVPMGYPTSCELNKDLLDFEKFPVSFSSEGVLQENTTQNTVPQNQYDKYFSFCKEIISAYSNEQGNFDYECFFDFIKSEAIYAEPYKTIEDKYISDGISYHQLITFVLSIYNQMVAYLIKDNEGNRGYEHLSCQLRCVEHYNNFLKLLSSLKEKYIIDVHTLNHDLFFESLNRTEWLNGDISDGFDEFGSEYYGKLNINDCEYTCRLQRYTGYYNTAIRLYKLHGSLNYILYYKDHNHVLLPDKCVKLRRGISPSDLLRGKGCKKHYEEFPFAPHANLLTGTTSKILQYNSPYFYKKVFSKFRKNLKKSTFLLVIRYGAKDVGINEILLKYCHDKPVYIIDPFAEKNEAIKELASKLNATVYPIKIEELKTDMIVM